MTLYYNNVGATGRTYNFNNAADATVDDIEKCTVYTDGPHCSSLVYSNTIIVISANII